MRRPLRQIGELGFVATEGSPLGVWPIAEVPLHVFPLSQLFCFLPPRSPPPRSFFPLVHSSGSSLFLSPPKKTISIGRNLPATPYAITLSPDLLAPSPFLIVSLTPSHPIVDYLRPLSRLEYPPTRHGASA